MRRQPANKPVERLFPFARRAAVIVAGRETLRRIRRKLGFLLVTTDLSANSRERVLRDFDGLPVIPRYTAADVERFFGLKNTKIVGFKKSSITKSILDELRRGEPGASGGTVGNTLELDSTVNRSQPPESDA